MSITFRLWHASSFLVLLLGCADPPSERMPRPMMTGFPMTGEFSDSEPMGLQGNVRLFADSGRVDFSFVGMTDPGRLPVNLGWQLSTEQSRQLMTDGIAFGGAGEPSFMLTYPSHDGVLAREVASAHGVINNDARTIEISIVLGSPVDPETFEPLPGSSPEAQGTMAGAVGLVCAVGEPMTREDPSFSTEECRTAATSAGLGALLP